MYSPKTYLTEEILAEAVAEFEWPAPYHFEDDLPDGIEMIFPKSSLYFVEGFESEMDLVFFAEYTGLENAVSLKHVLIARGGVKTPDLINYFSPYASLDKVKNGIRDLCKIILTQFRSSIFGEFEWIGAYKGVFGARQGMMARDGQRVGTGGGGGFACCSRSRWHHE